MITELNGKHKTYRQGRYRKQEPEKSFIESMFDYLLNEALSVLKMFGWIILFLFMMASLLVGGWFVFWFVFRAVFGVLL